jgi:hypothetical protein
MTVEKRKAAAEKPARRDKESGADERSRNPRPRRPSPPEPFEECGPTGGYGGAGLDDEAKRDD